MSERTSLIVTEEISSSVVMLETSDKPALVRLLTLFEELEKALTSEGNEQVAQTVQDCQVRLNKIVLEESEDAEADLESISTAVSDLQRKLRCAEQSVPDSQSTGAQESQTISDADSQSTATVKVQRDEDTIAMLGDFLQESEEGLVQADQILIDIEHGSSDPEMVNSLFRVFHTIKGVAGFLDLLDVSSLSHQTETMLNMIRQGQLELHGEVLDFVFDATEMTRKLLMAVRFAVDRGEKIESTEGLDSLLSRIQAVPEGGISRAVDQSQASPQTEVAAGQESSGARGQVKEMVKVDAERLDRLIDTIGELVIAESMVSQAPEIDAGVSQPLARHLSHLDKTTRELQELGTSLRMIAVRGVFQKMARLTRDTAKRAGKSVEFVMSGEDTELDKAVVDSLSDPLVHMIRNAVDHGLESVEERLKAGKPEEGIVMLSAYHKGGSIYLEVEDDGRGLDRNRILRKAQERGLVNDGDSLTDSEIFDLIFEPGFSTAQKVTDVSGRGVGMDVVKKAIVALRGQVEIRSAVGKGTTFSIQLPLTLAIIDGMVVRVGQERYIIPTLSIITSTRPSPGDLSTVFSRGEMLSWQGKILPLFRLDRLFNVEDAQQDPSKALVVVIGDDGNQAGLLVDELLGQLQIVIKSLGESMRGTPGISGATIMPDGLVGLILDVGGLVKLATS